MIFSDISPNFINHIISDKDSIRNSIKNLIMIKKFTLMGKEKIGSKIDDSLFKSMLFVDRVHLEQEIKTVLKNYEPRIEVIDILVSDIDHSLFVDIFYKIKNSFFEDNTDSIKIRLNRG